MSALYIIYNLSPTYPWVFASLNANRDNLGDNNIVIPPADNALCERVPSARHLWIIQKDNLPLPDQLETRWKMIASTLEQGQDILLFTNTPRPMSHDFFYSELQKHVDIEVHPVKLLFLLGRPSLMLEQLAREQPDRRNLEPAREHSRRLTLLADLVKKAIDKFGASNVQCLPLASTSIPAEPGQALIDHIYKFLGVNPPASPARPLAPGLFRSEITRRLFDAMEVRGNVWPAIEPKTLENAIWSLDAQLPEDWLTPREWREHMRQIEVEPLGRLRKLPGLEESDLSAPEDYLAHPACNSEALPREMITKFCDLLGKDACAALHMRLHNDRHLLTGDQRAILDFLELEESFQAIGEPSEPVELTVLTMTYNHEKFIAECMDSVLMQQTSFPVRHLVLDHHSDDATPAIVAEYAAKYDSIRPVLLSQRAPCENVLGLFMRCRTKYAALCDGDDFFTETGKLQEQVDFLEKNSDCSICFHPVAARFDDGREPVIFPPLASLPMRSNRTFYLADIMDHNFIQTNSAVYRWRFRDGLPDWFRADLCPGDWYWHMLHAEKGKIGFIPKVMSVYRRHENALYKSALENHVEQRRKMGMSELKAYKAYNEHFKGRYLRPLSVLAASVFQDFLCLYLMGDDRYMNWAIEKHPEFRPAFLQEINDMNQALQDLDKNARKSADS